MPYFRKLILAAALAAVLPAWADVSRDDAAAIAQRLSQGRVLAVERAEAGNRPVWRVKVVTPAGDVRVVLIDMATGRPV
ncbi:MAG TPA: PepSY domain-containing protein [Ramlibacter sp.]|uniref:PepSY domain-containing protein n=1 Tax=Ramlibacter sp. TaxID=1917967 RepID=UPI002D80FA96|nr:PepSY domain-containing protein [Ramlibacter sp.]HET8745919.1 PepSY domain-containing protein [Ramlibacter sp.]